MTPKRSTPQHHVPGANTTSAAGRFTAFDGHHRLASGTLLDAALAVKRADEGGSVGPLLIFDDSTGRVTDVDTRGTDRELAERLAPEVLGGGGQTAAVDTEEGPRKRGRPTLGVVPREVTLLPRHWDWLNTQPGGASAALRRLVEQARRSSATDDRVRLSREAAYRFAHAVAGDLPGFEEATRALFAGDRARFSAIVEAWPQDVREYTIALAFAEPHDAESDVP